MKKIIIIILIVLSLSISVSATYEQPSGSAYYGLSSYSGTTVSGSLNFWTALANSTAGTAYKLGSSTTSGTVLYYLSNIYSKLNNGGGSSSWTSTQATNVTTYTQNLYNGYGFSSTNTLRSALSSIDTHIQAIGSPTVNTGWTSSQATTVTSNSNYLNYINDDVDTIRINTSQLNTYIPYLVELNGLSSSLSDINTNVQDNTDIVTDFYTYFSQSNTNVPFTYESRTLYTNNLTRTTLTDQVAFMSASSYHSKEISSITGSDLSFFDRLTLLNNNLVNIGTEILTPSTRYSQNYHDYIQDRNYSYQFVSIGDMIRFLTNVVDHTNRLSYIFADDDDIQIKQDTKNQRDYIASQYGSNGTAPSSSDMSDANDVLNDVTDVFQTGYSISEVSTSIAYANDTNNGLRFWSSWCSDAINNVQTNRSPQPEVIDWYSEHWTEITSMGNNR